MKPLPLSTDLVAVTPRVIWFEPPEKALADPLRFLAYLMAYGTAADIEIVRRHVADEDWREALDKAPPGIIDPRSWWYWNAMIGRYPPPPMPKRALPA